MDEIRDFSYEDLGRPAQAGEYKSPTRLAPVFVDLDLFSQWQAGGFKELVRCLKYHAMGDTIGYWLAIDFVGY
jgi:hypothetical protein